MSGPQLEMRFGVRECAHRHQFVTHAYVPCGLVCSDCDELVAQFIPQPPEVVGYLTADWAWHHRDGKPWTTRVGGRDEA